MIILDPITHFLKLTVYQTINETRFKLEKSKNAAGAGCWIIVKKKNPQLWNYIH